MSVQLLSFRTRTSTSLPRRQYDISLDSRVDVSDPEFAFPRKIRQGRESENGRSRIEVVLGERDTKSRKFLLALSRWARRGRSGGGGKTRINREDFPAGISIDRFVIRCDLARFQAVCVAFARNVRPFSFIDHFIPCRSRRRAGKRKDRREFRLID